MTQNSSFSLDLGDKVDLYFSLLSDENFDFKTKNILVNLEKKNNSIIINITCESLLDIKIANSAIIRSLEIIEKTLKI
jgi:hypothetical protein